MRKIQMVSKSEVIKIIKHISKIAKEKSKENNNLNLRKGNDIKFIEKKVLNITIKLIKNTEKNLIENIKKMEIIK